MSASAARLKAQNIVIAMLPDGRSRIGIQGSGAIAEAHRMGAAIWTPDEMLKFVEMSREERDVFRNLKQAFQATTEFSEK